MMMGHVAENLLNWEQSPTFSALWIALESRSRARDPSVPKYYKRLEFFVVLVENKPQNTSPLSPS